MQTALNAVLEAPGPPPPAALFAPPAVVRPVPVAAAEEAERAALEVLAAVDWDFRGAVTNGATHGFHPYPARFIPQIPAALMRAFTRPGDAVYDPFVGGGTTCAEANRLGRHALGGDVNELAALIARVKTHPLSESDAAACAAVADQARQYASAPAGADDAAAQAPALSAGWFEDFVVRELAAIRRAVADLPGAPARDFCRVAWSAILVGVSKQDSDTRYARVEKNLAPGAALARFQRQLQKMLRQMASARAELARATTVVKVADSRVPGAFAADAADFAVTSPPYPNAYDYHLYHRHRMLWLGMDPAALKRREIGAHAHYSRRNGPDENDFRDDMERVFRAAARVLKRGRYFALVVGDSILRGRRVRNRDIVKAAAVAAGYSPVADFRRNMDSRRKSFHPAHGSIHAEDIVILRNDRRR